MGQTSSQPGSPRLSQEPEADDAESHKGKKSKSKSKSKSRKTRHEGSDADPVAERAALEEESARALMQLSSSALHHDSRAPYYTREDDLQLPAHVAEQARSKDGEGKRPPKKKHKKKKKSKDVHRERSGQTEDDESQMRPAEDLLRIPPAHRLDQEASDNELVQEYAVGLSQNTEAYTNDAPQQRHVELDNQDERDPDQYDIDNPMTLRKGAKQKGSLKKRKRHTTQTGGDDVRGDEIPLDPALQPIGAFIPSANSDSLSNSRADEQTKGQTRNHRKRRRIEQSQHVIDEEGGDRNVYDYANVQVDSVAQAIPDLENESNRFSRRGDVPYETQADVDEVQQQAQPEKAKNRTSDKDAASGKQGFNADEIAKLDDFRDQYCKINDLPLTAFNHFVQSSIRSNEGANMIFNAIQELFPNRSRSSVQKFCRRRFHNFHARGVWTPEEDAELKAAVAAKGTSWKVIGEDLQRFSEDCRDRYRNYLAPSAENRNKDAWTETEVINLSKSILECMQRMKLERQTRNGMNAGHPVPISDSDSDQEADDLKLINWKTVSDLMGSYGTARSRIQCSFKWSKIKEADRGRYLKDIKEARKNLSDLENGNYTANNMKNSSGWRLTAAFKQVKNMKSGDKYDLLNGILGSVARHEENIPWRLIGDDAFRQRWTFSERKAGWFAMKEGIQGSEHMDFRQIAHQLLADLVPQGVTERWSINVHGLAKGSPAKRPRKNKNKIKSKLGSREEPELQTRLDTGGRQPGGAKSDEYVHDSDEDTEHVEVAAAAAAAPPPPPITKEAHSRHDRRSESPNSLFDDDEESPTYPNIQNQDFDTPNIDAQDTTSAEISPELATQIQTYLREAASAT